MVPYGQIPMASHSGSGKPMSLLFQDEPAATFFLHANSAKIRMKEFMIKIMMARDLKRNGT